MLEVVFSPFEGRRLFQASGFAGGLCLLVVFMVVESQLELSLSQSLKKPPVRVSLPDVSTPSSFVLEEAFYTGVEDIISAAEKLVRE